MIPPQLWGTPYGSTRGEAAKAGVAYAVAFAVFLAIVVTMP